MSGDDDVIPPDVVEEITEYERIYYRKKHRKKRKPIPTRSDIARAIRTVLRYYIGNVESFPDEVIAYLERNGYYTGRITLHRIWSIYEDLVKRKWITDIFGVVSNNDNEES